MSIRQGTADSPKANMCSGSLARLASCATNSPTDCGPRMGFHCSFEPRPHLRILSSDVAAPELAFEPGAEGLASFCRSRMEVNASASGVSHTTLFADQGGVAEQRRLDRQHVIAGRVAALVYTIEHEQLDGKARGSRERHGAECHAAWRRCPTQKWNRCERIDSRW